MSTETAEDLAGWSIGFAEDIDLPGWVLLPTDVPDDLREPWIAEVGAAVLGLIAEGRPDGAPAPEQEVHDLLAVGLRARADDAGSALVYLVFPSAAPVAVLCRVGLVRADDLPDLTAIPGRLYPAEARHVGPGLQLSTRAVIEDDDGSPIEVSAVHLFFTNAELGMMISLEEAPSAILSQALVGLGLFKNALALVRADGSTFTSTPPAARTPDDEWPLGIEETS